MSPFGRYARRVDTLMTGKERLLLIDTCGESAGVALSFGQSVLVAEDLEQGSASAEIVSAVRRLLQQAEWTLAELDAVGVVNGPGSFTGIRAGLAMAKGLCEAAGKPLLTVSRLEVLAQAATVRQGSIQIGFAALDAGRGELYVREASSGREWLSSVDSLVSLVRKQRSASSTDGEFESIAIAEERVAERLLPCATMLRPLHAGDALALFLQRLHEGGNGLPQDTSRIDANYVREESDIYGKPAATAKAVKAEVL